MEKKFSFSSSDHKRGISAKGLARQPGLAYESAWYLLVRIRNAMRERDHRYMLEGIIEMDEAYLGAPKCGKKRGRGTERKKMVVAVSKDEKNRLLFLCQPSGVAAASDQNVRILR